MTQTDSRLVNVNLDDPRQDVHKVRTHDPNLHRYRIAEQLLPAQASGLEVLELGGGIAELTQRMIRRGCRVTFVDLSEHNVRRAEALGIKAVRLDLNAGLSQFESQSFDGVVMLEVIEHIVAVEALLADVTRVLRPGGFLILSTPNFAFFLNRLRILSGRLSGDEGYHYRFFTVDVLRERLEAAGLRLVVSHHTAPAFGVNFVLNRLMQKSRRHVRVPGVFAGLFAHTLIVRAEK